jgi:hypothetical protein
MDAADAPAAIVPHSPPLGSYHYGMPSRWPLGKRIAFRFAFVYLVLYNFPFPLTAIRLFDPLSEQIDKLWTLLVWPVGTHYFGVNAEPLATGSGDTTFAFVEMFCMAVIALVATIVWSLLDLKRENYSRLDDWLRVYIRFALAVAMIIYGSVKVIPGQFPPPNLLKLTMTFGDQSPMGLLWSFMGASTIYTAFTGVAEMLAGILLTMRRTALLGSLMAIAVMTNVVMLNFCYDVPVKLYSSHLLLEAMFLAAPHAKRLADFLLFNRATEPIELPRLLPERWTRIAVPLVRTAAVVLFVSVTLRGVWHNYALRTARTQSPLTGLWNVEEFVEDGQTKPPMLSEGARWRIVAFDYGRFNVRQMDDFRMAFSAKFDEAKKQIAITRAQSERRTKATLSYATPQPSTLILSGTLDGKSIRATLKRIDHPNFLLTSRGFHWINEFPLNR